MVGRRSPVLLALAALTASLAACAGLIGVDDVGYLGDRDASQTDVGVPGDATTSDAAASGDGGLADSPSQPDAIPPDTGAGDSSRFCPPGSDAHTLCEDFDDGIAPTRWKPDITAGIADDEVATDASFSRPASFHAWWSTTPPPTNSEARAQILRVFVGAHHIIVNFRMNLSALANTNPDGSTSNVDSRVVGIGEWNLFLRKGATGTSAFVSVFDPQGTFIPDAGGDLVFGGPPMQQGIWYPVTVDVTLGVGGSYTVEIDPTGVKGQLQRGSMPATVSPGPTIAFGPQADQPFDTGSLFIDDITIDVVP